MRTEIREDLPLPALIEALALDRLFEALHQRGYTVIGPTVRGGAIVVAELTSAGELLYGAGTPAGADVLAALGSRAAGGPGVAQARDAVAGAADRIGHARPARNLPDLLAANRESPHWDDVASLRLTCDNCTMVCPTCCCTTTEDVTDLTGDRAVRGHPGRERRAMTSDRLAELCGAGRSVSYRAGDRIFAEGGTAGRFWLVETGSVALDLRVPGRGDQAVVERAGELMGPP